MNINRPPVRKMASSENPPRSVWANFQNGFQAALAEGKSNEFLKDFVLAWQGNHDGEVPVTSKKMGPSEDEAIAYYANGEPSIDKLKQLIAEDGDSLDSSAVLATALLYERAESGFTYESPTIDVELHGAEMANDLIEKVNNLLRINQDDRKLVEDLEWMRGRLEDSLNPEMSVAERTVLLENVQKDYDNSKRASDESHVVKEGVKTPLDLKRERRARNAAAKTTKGPEEPLELTEEQKLKDNVFTNTNAESRTKTKIEGETKDERRESRASNFAEKFGLTAEREAFLAVEAKYEQAFKINKTARTPWSKVAPDVLAEYNAARLNWTSALSEKTKDAHPLDKVEAKVIGFRDRILRAEELRTRATIGAMDERGKTAVGKALNWGKRGLAAPVKLFAGVTEMLGSGAAAIHGKVSTNENFDAQKTAEKYTKAVRIFSAAALGTLMGAVPAAGLGVSFALRLGRGVLGTVLGTTAAYGAGSLYKNTLGESGRQKLHAARRVESVATSEDLKNEEKAQRSGSYNARVSRQKKIEMFTAIAVGAGVSLESNKLLHSWLDTPAADHAAKVILDSQESFSGDPVGFTNPDSAHVIAPVNFVDMETGSHPETFSVNATEAHAAPGPVMETLAEKKAALANAVNELSKETPAVGSAVSGAEHIDASSMLEGHTNNADRMLGDLRHAIEMEKSSGAHTNPAIEKFLSLGRNQDEIAKALGFQDEHSMSAVMHEGDRISVVDNEIVFQPAHGEIHVLVEANGDINKLDMSAGHVTPPVEAHASHGAAPEVVQDKVVHSPIIDNHADAVAEANAQTLNTTEYAKHFGSPTDHAVDHSATASVHSELSTNSQRVVESVTEAPKTLPEGVLFNQNSLQIDTRFPHIYSQLDSKGNAIVTAYGGNDKNLFSYAQQYLKSHPNSTLRVAVPNDSFFGFNKTYSTLEISSDENGGLRMPSFGNEATEKLPLPDPQGFKSQIDK